MFDLGWTELLVIGIVALIVVGPKDLPILFRRVGQFVGKAKGMAREFSSAMNDAADESGVREMSSSINKSLKAATNPIGSAMDGVKSAAKSLTDIDPESETGKLAAKRAEDTAKIQAATARAGAERLKRQAEEAAAKADAAEAALKPAEPAATPKPGPKPVAGKKAPPRPPSAKKAAAAKKKAQDKKTSAARQPADGSVAAKKE